VRIRSVPWKVLVAVIIAAIFYGELVIEFAPDRIWGLLNTLLATFLSALLALAVGIWLFNTQSERADERRRQQIIEGLIAELKIIRDEVVTDDSAAFTPVMTVGGEFHQILLPEGLELITFDEAIRSGLLPTDVTVQLINLAGSIRAYDARVRRAQATLQAEVINKEEVEKRGAGYLLDSTPKYLETGRTHVRDECERMLSTLEQLRS
jgi:hypothetical protein